MSKIFIHEGHGGMDPGAVGPTGLKEKDVTLKVAKKVEQILKTHNQEVILARGKDISLKSYNAANEANRLKVDYVVSIHCNSARNPNATGTETYAYSTTSEGSKLAQKVQKNLVNQIKLPNRGVKYNNQFAIIRKPYAPAILVEIAFINNPREESLLRDESFLDKAALGIAKGLLEHIGVKYEDNTVKVDFRGRKFKVEGIMQDNKNYVSIRELAENMGYTVGWEQSTETVVIK